MLLRTLFGADRRVILLLLTSITAVVLGFFSFTADRSMQAVIYGGYWAMLVIFALFVWSLIKLVPNWAEAWARVRSVSRATAALIAICGTVLLVHEPYGFKILMDEAMLLGTSMSMHFDKLVLVPMRGNDIQGAFQVLNGELDKRPMFQPFLTSLLHDLFGYRPENVFILNTLLTFVLLGLAYHVGRKIAGRSGGVLIVLLLTSLPLLAQNATGGGFELLNLVMILATLALAMRFAEKRDADSQNAMALAAVLLTQTRYESVLFLLPVALVVAWVWWRERRPVLNVVFCCTPLLLLPYALHNRVFSARASSWELASQPGHEHAFSLGYIGDNIAHDLNFFFNTNGEQSNSLVIAVLGFLAAPFFLLWAVKTLRVARDRDPARVTTALFAIGFAAHTALLLCYFWGKFDDPVIRRLSLPLNLALAIGVVTVVTEFGGRIAARLLIVVTVIGIFGHALPAMARHDFTQDYYIGREAEWRRDFMAAHPEHDYLVIDNSSIFWITHLVSATPMIQATQHKDNVYFCWQNHIFTGIYAFQRFEVDEETGKLTVQRDDDLGPDYQLQTVWERRFTPLRVSRISRVVAIKSGPLSPPARKPLPIEKLSPAAQEKARRDYFEKFIQKLP
jgi:hypothetical protein